ncbi:acetylornithine deacetylase [uncultured Pluralibacter sp.]|uniref:acetylornithine deacetylase n=1 Tax=uncultured Pluralibacter sp. TaxID=1490864 RepID=UPI002620772A|nr:acetylornithine deacetylase [uncultured Pluralibacter sp.]
MNSALESLLARLLAFDTTSRESNLAMIDFIDDVLSSKGIITRRFYDEQGKKANLLARIGPDEDGGVMLSGHTDVVPVDGQSWTVPPFSATRRDGRIYGRGSADMKGFIGCVLAALPDFLSGSLRMPLWLAFSYDEEVGCLGVRSLVEHLRASAHKPAMCIVGEPTEMRPVYGHKGKLAMRCCVEGLACHSAYAPLGVNAIEYAAKVINRITVLGEELSASRDARFSPPFSTIQVGVIQGGSALNIVPQSCQFDFEIRHLPGHDTGRTINALERYAFGELRSNMRNVAPDSDISFQVLSRYPGLLTDPQSDFARWLMQWSGSDDFSTVAFGTEGGLFDEVGIATLVCGPGSMEQGHKPDEFVSEEQLNQCMAMLENLRQWMQD